MVASLSCTSLKKNAKLDMFRPGRVSDVGNQLMIESYCQEEIDTRCHNCHGCTTPGVASCICSGSLRCLEEDAGAWQYNATKAISIVCQMIFAHSYLNLAITYMHGYG